MQQQQQQQQEQEQQQEHEYYSTGVGTVLCLSFIPYRKDKSSFNPTCDMYDTSLL